ncbi:MAG: hypothetical protein D6734_01135 [Candidatus Schekmanbacteria bacterium]|nr:MAG: hypothetical protein D6734_01135 [Candidatus Schekmanbacteria bacterium]
MALLVENAGKILNIETSPKKKHPIFFSYLLRFFLAGLFLYSAVTVSNSSLIFGLVGYLVPLFFTVVFPEKVILNLKKTFLKVRENA